MKKAEEIPCNPSLNTSFLIARLSLSTGKKSEKDLSTATRKTTSKEHP